MRLRGPPRGLPGSPHSPQCEHVGFDSFRSQQQYGEGFNTGPPQVGAGSLNVSVVFVVFGCFWSFSLGSRPAFLPSRPYF